jgi:hypothetical protein
MIVGTQQRTQVYGAMRSNRFQAIEESGDEGGDGTVPRGAAIPWELDFGSGEFYVADHHSALMANKAGLDHLAGVMTGMSLMTLRGKGPEEQVPRSLCLIVNDAYQRRLPIEIDIIASEGASVADMTAVITDPQSTKSAKARTIKKQDNRYHAVFDPMPPNVYRVTAHSQIAKLSVNDLVAVF